MVLRCARPVPKHIWELFIEMKSTLIQPLFDGPLDIVGDIHGEMEPLCQLLKHLGYQSDGRHPEDRRLIFVGDLTDRGPDSPGVVELVQRLIENGRAQCVLGNHDLNILLNHRKFDNGWYFGSTFEWEGSLVPQALADHRVRGQVQTFLQSLPVALEREDLRVIHACWNDGAVDLLRDETDIVTVYERFRQSIDEEMTRASMDNIDRELAHQNQNPVKLLTSGPEVRTETPIVSSGKTRFEKRVTWWNDYHDVFCVFGHYSVPEEASRGNESSFCNDYGIGKRWTERRQGKKESYQTKLAALRWPEKKIVFDSGEIRIL